MKIGDYFTAVTEDKYSSDESGNIYILKKIEKKSTHKLEDYYGSAISPPIREPEMSNWEDVPFSKDEIDEI